MSGNGLYAATVRLISVAMILIGLAIALGATVGLIALRRRGGA